MMPPSRILSASPDRQAPIEMFEEYGVHVNDSRANQPLSQSVIKTLEVLGLKAPNLEGPEVILQANQ